MHFPLVASIVLAGAALLALMEEDEIESEGIKWYFGGGIAVAMLSLAIIGALHKSLDRKGSALISVRPFLYSKCHLILCTAVIRTRTKSGRSTTLRASAAVRSTRLASQDTWRVCRRALHHGTFRDRRFFGCRARAGRALTAFVRASVHLDLSDWFLVSCRWDM